MYNATCALSATFLPSCVFSFRNLFIGLLAVLGATSTHSLAQGVIAAGSGSYTVAPCGNECTTLCEEYGDDEHRDTWNGTNITTSVNNTPPTIFIVEVTANTIITGSSLTFSNIIFRVSPGVRITISTSIDATFTNCMLFSCDTMWRGIVLEQKSGLTMVSCIIEDAQYAIHGYHQAIINLTDNTFNRNYVGVYYRATLATPPFSLPYPPVSINTFTGNLFTCCDYLNTPYTGQTPTPLADWAATGMDIKSGGYSIGVTASSNNIFTCMFQGAQFESATLTMEHCEFHYMVAYIGGSPPLNYKTRTGLAVLKTKLNFIGEYGFGPTSPTISNIYNYGIYAGDSPLTVSTSYLDKVGDGIYVEGMQSDNVLIENSRFDHSLSSGINLWEINSAHEVKIEDNEFYDHDFTHLYIADRDNHSNTLKVYNNYFEQNVNFSFMIENAPALQGNIEYLYNTFLNNTNFSLMGMVHLHKNAGNFKLVENNTFTGSSATSSHAGLYIDDFENAYYCDNSFDNIGYGMHFLDNCDQSQIRNNHFGDHKIGLKGTDFILNLIQQDYGNTWQGAGSYSVNAADYSGSNFINAIFRSTTTSPFYPPTMSPSSGWFFSTVNTPGECVHHDPEGLAPEYSKWIADQEMPMGEFEEVYRWNSLRIAHDLLFQNPSWMTGNMLLENFYSENEFGDIGLLNEVRRKLSLCSKPTYQQLENLNELNFDQDNVIDQILSIDVALATPGADISMLMLQKEVLQQELIIILQQIDSILSVVQSASIQCNQDLLLINDLVVGDKSYVATEKDLNEIILTQGAEGRKENNSEEQARLLEIAAMCYGVGGQSVARATFKLKDMALAAYYEAFPHECDLEDRQKSKSENSTDIKLYPNPAKDKLTIDFGKTGFVSYNILNGACQEIVEFDLDEKDQITTIDIRNWPSGIYFMRLVSSSGVIHLEKFSVFN